MNIELRHIRKAFGQRVVLEDLSLTLQAQTVTCICGPSGCGKTTLLRILAGLTLPDGGTVVGLDSPAGVLFQEPRLIPAATLLQNVRLAQTSSGMAAEEALRRVGLADSAARYPAELSGGMRQRAAIARLLAFGGGVWLLDEPFKEQDPATRERLWTLMRAQWVGKTVILVTHDSAEAHLLGDRILTFGDRPMTLIQDEMNSPGTAF